LGIDDVRIG